MAQAVSPESNSLNLERFARAQQWLELNPQLNVCNVKNMQTLGVPALSQAAGNALEELLVREGYFHLPQVDWGLPIGAMAEGIGRLVERGLAASFCYMYDEYWLIFFKLHKLLARLLGEDYCLLPDFWAWHVDPRAGQSGWKPHRDKGRRSLFPDRRPKSLSIWLPLTEATPLNGCMYLVPADRDPTYGTEQEKDWRFAYQDVRALPSPAGGLFCWTAAVVHWGGHSSPRAVNPRISLAFEFQRGDVPPFNQPLLKPLAIPTIEQRLTLICKQILQYRHMYPLTPELQRFAEGRVAA